MNFLTYDLCPFFREGDGEDGASSWWAVGRYGSFVFVDDDIVTDAEAEAGAFSLFLGGKEGFKDAIYNLFRYSRTIITDGAEDTLCGCPCFDGDGAWVFFCFVT